MKQPLEGSRGYKEGQSAPRCQRVGKFLAKVVEQKLNTSYFNKKITFYPEIQFHVNLFLMENMCK